jgi:hypothetical protein
VTVAAVGEAQQELRKAADEAVVTGVRAANLPEVLIDRSKNKNERDRKHVDDLLPSGRPN